MLHYTGTPSWFDSISTGIHSVAKNNNTKNVFPLPFEDDWAYGDEDEIETGDAAEGSDEEIDLDSLDHMARMIAEIKIEQKKLKRDKVARDSVPQAVLFTPTRYDAMILVKEHIGIVFDS